MRRSIPLPRADGIGQRFCMIGAWSENKINGAKIVQTPPVSYLCE